MEQHQCVVCGKTYDKRLKNSMEQHTVTGRGLCPEHQAQVNEGYILCVCPDTGHLAAVREEVWPQLFNAPVPPKKVCYIEPQVAEYLMNLV